MGKVYTRKDNAIRAAIKLGLTDESVYRCDGGWMFVHPGTEGATIAYATNDGTNSACEQANGAADAPTMTDDEVAAEHAEAGRVHAEVTAAAKRPRKSTKTPAKKAAKPAKKTTKKAAAAKPATEGAAPRGRGKNPETVAKYMALVTREGGATFAEIMNAIGDKPRKWLFGVAAENGYTLDLVKTDRTAGHYVATKIA